MDRLLRSLHVNILLVQIPTPTPSVADPSSILAELWSTSPSLLLQRLKFDVDDLRLDDLDRRSESDDCFTNSSNFFSHVICDTRLSSAESAGGGAPSDSTGWLARRGRVCEDSGDSVGEEEEDNAELMISRLRARPRELDIDAPLISCERPCVPSNHPSDLRLA